MSDPEGNIKGCMNKLADSFKEKFGSLNDEILKRLDAQGVKLDRKAQEQLLLDLKKVQISVNSDGDIEIKGMLSSDEETNAKGMAIIEELANAMINNMSDNSYHVNLFNAASQSLLQRQAEQNGDSKYNTVVAELWGGNTVKIRTMESQNMAANYTDVKDMLFHSMIGVLRS